MKTALRLLTAVLLFFAILLPAAPARADMAPPPPPEGASIAPGAETTQVRMVAETVLVDIGMNKTGDPARAKVTATFQMRNQGSSAESMEARFPLNSLSPSKTVDEKSCEYPDFFPIISDFTAAIEGKPAQVTNHSVYLDNSWTGKPAKQVNCWASFPVRFDPGKDVKVQVSYSVEGYYNWGVSGLVQFTYVLVTGSGWKDTIGSADVTFRAPIPLTSETLFEQPAVGPAGTINGNEIRFHYENFEPDMNPSVTIMDPSLWQRIQKETANVQKTPSDGEAWGRLGKAYKEAITQRRGYRWDAAGAEMYQKSKDAYEKSVTLLPKDADWHGGYAELLWNNVIFPSYGDRASQRDALVKAAQQVQLALAINPNQKQANQVLDDMQRWTQGDLTKNPLVNIVNGKPVFLALTQTPTLQPTDIVIPTETPTLPPSPTAALPNATFTLPPTLTLAPAATDTPAAVAQSEPSATVQAAPPTPTQGKPQGSRGICGAGLVPVGLVVFWAWRRKLVR